MDLPAYDHAGSRDSQTDLNYQGGPSTSVPSTNMAWSGSGYAAALEAEDAASVLPPSYDTARAVAPADALAYNFVTDVPGVMLLVPPPDAPPSQPAFHVSVLPNCFAPSSYVTTLRRGANSRGEVVGQFEMGGSARPSTVTTDGWHLALRMVLAHEESRRSGVYIWQPNRPGIPSPFTLRWQYDGLSMSCHHLLPSSQSIHLATFTFASLHPHPAGVIPPSPSLRLAPAIFGTPAAGATLLPHVILSALVLERRRLEPDSADDLAVRTQSAIQASLAQASVLTDGAGPSGSRSRGGSATWQGTVRIGRVSPKESETVVERILYG